MIVKIGDTLGKPVVATCDAHYLEDYDGISRNVLLRGIGMKDGDRDSHLSSVLRTRCLKNSHISVKRKQKKL